MKLLNMSKFHSSIIKDFSIIFYHDLNISFILTQVYGAFRVAVKMLLMWNSKIQIDGGGNTVVTSSVLEVRNLVVLRVGFEHHLLTFTMFGFTPCLNLTFFFSKKSFLKSCLATLFFENCYQNLQKKKKS